MFFEVVTEESGPLFCSGPFHGDLHPQPKIRGGVLVHTEVEVFRRRSYRWQTQFSHLRSWV